MILKLRCLKENCGRAQCFEIYAERRKKGPGHKANLSLGTNFLGGQPQRARRSPPNIKARQNNSGKSNSNNFPNRELTDLAHGSSSRTVAEARLNSNGSIASAGPPAFCWKRECFCWRKSGKVRVCY